MPISWFDLILLLILAGFTFNGLFKGLIRLLGRLVGLIVGAIIASNFYIEVFTWSQNFFNLSESIGKILSFIVLFVVATIIVNWLFIYLEKFFNLISIIPFTKLINRLLGGILGFLEGALFLGLIVYIITRYAWLGGLFGGQLEASIFTPSLLWFIQLILPILPAAIKASQSIIINN